MRRIIWQVTTPQFSASLALGFWTMIVRQADTPLFYMEGWEARRVLHYCLARGWQVKLVEYEKGQAAKPGRWNLTNHHNKEPL